ncbi:MAG: transketolase [Firmicutes bacterium]|nr:transketolase [Bacillota bacterium]
MDLKLKANQIRRDTLNCIGALGVGHIGGALSIAELLAVLYFKHMRIDPKNPQLQGRDRLIVSKGHAGPAVYAALSERGYFPKEMLLTLNQAGTNLPSHCDMNKTTGVDMTTGSLGQGFSCAAGVAKASSLRGDGATIYTVIGDGESQEGQIWEAAMFAAHHKLSNLIAFTDYNGYQIDGAVDEICDVAPLDKKWRAFGWNVFSVDGHDTGAIDAAITSAKRKRNHKPNMIILNTVKGKGVSFIEAAKAGNHNMTMSREQTEAALRELE